MKAKLEFNLPEDKYEYKLALEGGTYKKALSDIYEYLHDTIKYKSNEMSDKESAVLNTTYIKFFEILHEHKIDLFD